MSEFTTAILNKLQGKNTNLPSPGTMETLHKESRGVLPQAYMIDGAKFELNSHHNQNFQTTHSFGWGSAQAPSSYHFGAMFANAQTVLHGLVDHTGSLQARGHYNWIPVVQPELAADGSSTGAEVPVLSSTSKIQAQLTSRPGQNVVHLEHEFNGEDFSVSFKGANVNPLDAPSSNKPSSPTVTGTFSASYLQSISRSLALGVEWTLQKPYPDVQEYGTAYSLRYAPPPSVLPPPPSLPNGAQAPYQPVNPRDPTQVFTTTYTPAAGMIHSSYWRRLNQRLEVVTELQMLVMPKTRGEPGRREGIATVGFKLDTVFATIRSAFESTGRLTTVLEEKVTPNLGFQLNGEIDYAKGGAGRVGFGFTFEQ